MVLDDVAGCADAVVVAAATAQPDTLSRTSLAIVDEDGSALSLRIRQAFLAPQFIPPETIGQLTAALGA
mgnify:CR=1 FL=1